MAALNDFTYYNNRSLGGIEDPNNPQAQANLQAIRQYDPNANYRPTYGSDGQLLGYTLDVDASKLPGTSGTGSLGGVSGHGSGADYMPNFSTVQPNMQLKDPNAVTNSPTYGRITQNTNINQPSSPLDYLGPAAVAAFAFGIPYVASAMSGGALGAGAAGGAAGALDTGGDSYLGLTNDGFPAFQGVPGTDFPALDTSGDSFLGLDDGTQAAAPIVESGQSARVMDVLRNGGVPGVDNIVQSGRELLGGITPSSVLHAASSLVGAGSGGGGGAGSGGVGGGGLLQPYNMQPYKSLTSMLKNYFGLLGGPHG